MPHVSITTGGSNAGSCGGLVDYLEKENRLKALPQQEQWFDQQRQDIRPHEVRQGIDANVAKLKKTEAKFYLVNISPSQKELQHLGNDPQQLKDYARGVMAEYAANFGKGLGADDVKWYGKVEYNRAYKWTDAGVQQGVHQRGEVKAGYQMHVQIIVSRKDSHNQKLLSPLTNHRGGGKSEVHGQKFGQFNRVAFKERSEVAFDAQFSYARAPEETFRYQNTMSHGTAQERALLLVEQRSQEREKEKEQQRIQQQIEQTRQAEKAETVKQAPLNEQTQAQTLNPTQELLRKMLSGELENQPKKGLGLGR